MAPKRPHKNSLRTRAEAQVKELADSFNELSMQKAKTLLHELEVHQIELEMQNQELRETQHHLEEVRDQYTDLFDFAPVGYLVLDKKGIIQDLNLTACSLMGKERSLIRGKSFATHVSPELVIPFLKKLKEAFDSGAFPYLEIEIKRSDGSTFISLLHGNMSIYDGEANVCRISMQDITELKKTKALELRHEALKVEKATMEHYSKDLEEKVRERSAALAAEKRINELKSTFISIASHELRTPITIISTSIALIQRYHQKKQYEREQRLIDRIRSSVDQFSAILDDLLSLDKLEQGYVRVSKAHFDLGEFVTNLIKDLEGFLKPGQQIYPTLEGNRNIVQDEVMLRHILSNLLSNAIKFSERDIGLQSSVKKDTLTIRVIDTGMGIPKEDRQYLFKRFFRAKNVEFIPGTGLGLSIVQRYLDLLGGSIDFTSQLDRGSTFTIRIPLAV